MMRIKITVREILFSTIIISGIFGLGILIDRSFIPRLTEKALKIVSAVQIDNLADRFDYIRRTEVGDFMAAGVLEARNPVSLSELHGGRKYLEIKKEKERYTEHTRTVTETDKDGHTHTHTETYYSWDYSGKEKYRASEYNFLGQIFKYSEVKFSYRLQRDTTIYEHQRGFWGPREGDIRYIYTTWPEKTIGLMMGVSKDKWYKELVFEKDQSIKGKIEWAERRIRIIPYIFWTFWILLILGLVFGFYWLENDWLEDKKEKRI